MSTSSTQTSDLVDKPERSPAWRSLRTLARRVFIYVRLRESLLLQGTPLIGAAFAIREISSENIVRMAIFAAASFFLVVYVFLVNDWAGLRVDLNDPHRRPRWTVAETVCRRELGVLAVICLGLSLAGFTWLALPALVIASVLALFGFVYSGPAVAAKGVPVLSSALHFVGGGIHFLLGYSVFSPIDSRGILIAVFFGLTLTAGHLNHEARDHEGDSLNDIRTNAVTFGRFPTFLASTVGFAAAYAYLVALALFAVVPRALSLAAVLLPVQLFASLRTVREGLSFLSIRRLQVLYRALFAVIGVLMLVALLLERRPGGG